MTVTDNISLQGSPALTNHILSGFSNSNWGYKDITINLPTYNSWEAGCKFTTGSDVLNQGTVLSSMRGTSSGSRACGFGIDIYNGNLRFLVTLDRYYSNVLNLQAPISANTTYTLKAKFTGSAYELYLDGVLEASISNSSKGIYNSNYNNKLYLGQYRDTADAFIPFTGGTIDLNGCYFIADGNILWQGVERSKTHYSPARKTSGFYIPTRKRLISEVKPLTLLGNATISNNNILTTDYNYLYTSATMTEKTPLDTANTWEWRTKFTRTGNNGNNYGTVIGHNSTNFRGAPYLQVVQSESGMPAFATDIVIPMSSSSYIGSATYSHSIALNTTYYMKFGFNGTSYYLLVNTTGWNDAFEEWARYDDSRKCYIGSGVYTQFLNRGASQGSSGAPTTGSMDLNETKLFINGDIYWEYITNKIVNDYYIPTRKDNS